MRKHLFTLLVTLAFIAGFITGSTTTNTAAAQAPGCPPAKESTYPQPTDVTVTGPAIVHPWWNNGKPSFGQTQVRVKVDSGSVTFIAMMGKSWTYTGNDACKANLDKEFNNAGLPVKTVDELVKEGLAKASSSPDPQPPAQPPAQQPQQPAQPAQPIPNNLTSGTCQAMNGYTVCGPFLQYWNSHGGLAQQGYPISAVRWEVSTDGKMYPIQWFERARFELHSNNVVMLTLLGVLGMNNASCILPAPMPPAPQPQPPAQPPAPPSGGTSACQAEQLGPWAPSAVGETFEVTMRDAVAVAGFWWPGGNTPWGNAEVSVWIPNGTSITVIQGGGTAWRYPLSCEAQAKADFDKHVADRPQDTNHAGVKTLDELRALGLVRDR